MEKSKNTINKIKYYFLLWKEKNKKLFQTNLGKKLRKIGYIKMEM